MLPGLLLQSMRVCCVHCTFAHVSRSTVRLHTPHSALALCCAHSAHSTPAPPDTRPAPPHTPPRAPLSAGSTTPSDHHHRIALVTTSVSSPPWARASAVTPDEPRPRMSTSVGLRRSAINAPCARDHATCVCACTRSCDLGSGHSRHLRLRQRGHVEDQRRGLPRARLVVEHLG
jgi:hypothetical protein